MHVRLRAGQLDTASRKLDRRREQLLPRQATVGAVRSLEPGDRARHGTRRRPDQERLGRRRLAEPDVDDLHLAALPPLETEPGGGDEEIREPRRAIARAVDQHEAARAGSRQRALGGRSGEGCRDARVDRVSSLCERTRAGLRGERMAPGDGALHRREPSVAFA